MIMTEQFMENFKRSPAYNIGRVWQKWRFSAPKTHLWLIKVWFSASTFVVKIATFAKPETVGRNMVTPTHYCYSNIGHPRALPDDNREFERHYITDNRWKIPTQHQN
jgi:hypothetical protein